MITSCVIPLIRKFDKKKILLCDYVINVLTDIEFKGICQFTQGNDLQFTPN